MVMQTIHLYDRLDIVRSREPGIRIQSNLNFLPVNENNLVYKAGMLLMDEFGITDGVGVRLTKRIPVAASILVSSMFMVSGRTSTNTSLAPASTAAVAVLEKV